jgi:hypothetical protein
MPRRKRQSKRRTDLEPGVWEFLIDDPNWKDAMRDGLLALELEYPQDNRPDRVQPTKARRLWEENREEVLAYYLEHFPGRRPPLWWRYDAPRQPLGAHPGSYYDGKREEPRLRLSGAGALPESHVPHFENGLPKYVHSMEGLDRGDPLVFESQAAYLERHGLLTHEEREQLTEEDYKPEVLGVEVEQ